METLGTVLERPIPKRFYKLFLIVVGVLIILALGLYMMLRLDDSLAEQQVQQALDQHCGQGNVSAKDGYYSYDPQFRWESANASCYTDIISGEFTCRCPNTP